MAEPKINLELTVSQAMSVSCGVGEYFRRLEKRARNMNPNDKLAKSIVKDAILDLGTVYTNLEEAIRTWREG